MTSEQFALPSDINVREYVGIRLLHDGIESIEQLEREKQ